LSDITVVWLTVNNQKKKIRCKFHPTKQNWSTDANPDNVLSSSTTTTTTTVMNDPHNFVVGQNISITPMSFHPNKRNLALMMEDDSKLLETVCNRSKKRPPRQGIKRTTSITSTTTTTTTADKEILNNEKLLTELDETPKKAPKREQNTKSLSVVPKQHTVVHNIPTLPIVSVKEKISYKEYKTLENIVNSFSSKIFSFLSIKNL